MDTHSHHTEAPREQGAALAIAQFVVTAVLLGLVGTLAYFAGLRSAGKEAPGGEKTGAAPAASVDVATLLKPTPELVAKGKELFGVNCASCHGANGFGDGPAAAALNPKPRNFHEGYWKYGGGVARIVQTISNGSPGTAMAAFSGIPMQDRFALAHYVRTFGTKPQEDKPEDLAWLGPIGGAPSGGAPGGGATGGGGAPAGGAPQPGPTISIEAALRAMTEPSPKPVAVAAAQTGEGPGAALYAERCARCHGAGGEGGVRVRMLGSSPYAYLTTSSLGQSRIWAGDPGRFERLILEGIPGYAMPANGDLSRSDIRDLNQYMSSLRARQAGAGGSAPAAPPSAMAPNPSPGGSASPTPRPRSGPHRS